MQQQVIGKTLQTTNLQENKPIFSPSQEEANLITTYYNDFISDYSIKNQSWEVLNNRTLNEFWTNCNYDYNQTIIQEANNPVTQYSSGITRDQANTLISALTQNYSFPSITAFNDQQQIDYVISSIGKPILKWQYINDGRPSESGKSKSFRYTHKQVVEGTTHIIDLIGPDGKLTSSIIPNEEVFIPNYYQPNVQLQSHFFWVQQFSSYGEAQAEFGEFENFKYVTPGNLGWINETYDYKERYKALVYQDQCTIVRGWYPVRKQELKRLIADGKLPKGTKKAKYFNVVINGVNMFPWDNLMPYYHGDYPITKAIFEPFSPAEFYWGNSVPNKCAQDKHFRDGWMTLTRYVAKMQAIPAMINASGQHLENDVYVPGVTTDVPAGTDPSKFFVAPGTDRPNIISQMLQMNNSIDGEINRSTAAPQVSGQANNGSQTKYETMVLEQNSQGILKGLAQQITFREEARAFPILKASFQFLPRQKIKMLAIPDEIFPDGNYGTLEVIFKKLPDMTEEERLQESYAIKQKEKLSEKSGHGLKQVYVDPDYIQNIDLYCQAIAENLPRENNAFKTVEAEHKWQTYLSAPPGIFNLKPAARNLIRAYGDNEKEMIAEAPMSQPINQPGEIPEKPPNPLNAIVGQQTKQLNPQLN